MRLLHCGVVCECSIPAADSFFSHRSLPVILPLRMTSWVWGTWTDGLGNALGPMEGIHSLHRTRSFLHVVPAVPSGAGIRTLGAI